MVDLERSLFGAAMLAFLGKETLDDLTADAAVDSRRTVAHDCILFPCQRDAAEHGHKWLLALTPLPCDDQGRLNTVDLGLSCRSGVSAGVAQAGDPSVKGAQRETLALAVSGS